MLYCEKCSTRFSGPHAMASLKRHLIEQHVYEYSNISEDGISESTPRLALDSLLREKIHSPRVKKTIVSKRREKFVHVSRSYKAKFTKEVKACTRFCWRSMAERKRRASVCESMAT